MLVGGILGYVFREKVRYSMEQEMYSSIKSYNEKKSIRRAWDDTQENVSGIHKHVYLVHTYIYFCHYIINLHLMITNYISQRD